MVASAAMLPAVSRKPDPSIEEIEAELLKARFEGIDPKTEAMLSRRARNQMRQAEIASNKDDRVKRAFLAGYRAGAEKRENIFLAVAAGCMLGVPLLIAVLLRTFIH